MWDWQVVGVVWGPGDCWLLGWSGTLSVDNLYVQLRGPGYHCGLLWVLGVGIFGCQWDGEVVWACVVWLAAVGALWLGVVGHLCGLLHKGGVLDLQEVAHWRLKYGRVIRHLCRVGPRRT